MRRLVLIPLLCLAVVHTHASIIATTLPSSTTSTIASLSRGGGGGGGDTPATTTTQFKKKKRRKRHTQEHAKRKVSKVLAQSDSAEQAMGNAIRDHADTLRSDHNDDDELLLNRIDDTVCSVGWAMGSSDGFATKQQQSQQEEGGGVEAATTSVLAHYFLKSHGGAHGLQCLSSLLATLAAAATLLLPNQSAALKVTCLKRSLQFAMTKHVSGLLAASTMAATAIPHVGLRQARLWMESLSDDPVSQYLFYTALVLVWLPPTNASHKNQDWWWWKPPVGRYSPLLLVGPILIREAISTLFVLSDVLVLLTTNNDNNNNNSSSVIQSMLQMGQTVTNVVMSLLVTPSVWNKASPAQRQAVLAKLTSRLCLVLEVGVGLLITTDGLVALWQQSFSTTTTTKPSLVTILKRMVCARLYWNYLWIKRRKVVKLAAQLRGGAAQFPMRVLNVILEPKIAMGMVAQRDEDDEEEHLNSWKDYARVALGFT